MVCSPATRGGGRRGLHGSVGAARTAQFWPKIAPCQAHWRAETGLETQTTPVATHGSVSYPCNGPKHERRALRQGKMWPKGAAGVRARSSHCAQFWPKFAPTRLAPRRAETARQTQTRPLKRAEVFHNPAMDPNKKGDHFYLSNSGHKGAARVPARSSYRPDLAKNCPQPGTSAG